MVNSAAKASVSATPVLNVLQNGRSLDLSSFDREDTFLLLLLAFALAAKVFASCLFWELTLLTTRRSPSSSTQLLFAVYKASCFTPSTWHVLQPVPLKRFLKTPLPILKTDLLVSCPCRLKRPGGHAAGPKSLSPFQLLESVCWRVIDSPVTARVYCDSDRESSPGAHSNHGLQPNGNRELSPGAHGNYELQPNIGWHSPDEQTVDQWGNREPPIEWSVQGALIVSPANGGRGAGSETRLRGMKER